jgi:ankyrin repeat protein
MERTETMRKEHRILLISVLLAFAGCGSLNPDTPLTSAASQNQIAEVQALLAQGDDPNGKDSHGWSPLMWAARKGNIFVVRALLKAGANPDLRDSYRNGWTPLIHAIHKHQNKTALALLDGGGDPNVKAPDGGTALIMAAGDGNFEMVRALLARGADPAAETSAGVTALAIGVAGGAFSDIDRPLLGNCHTEIVRALLEKDPGLKLTNNLAGRYARFFARLKGCSEVSALVGSRGRDH